MQIDLFEPRRTASLQFEISEVKSNQHLADELTTTLFESYKSKSGDKNIAPYQQSNSQLCGADRDSIISHEKDRWSEIFCGAKIVGGILAAHRFAPSFLPQEIAKKGLLTYSKTTGMQYVVIGAPTPAQYLKELKGRYTASCIGGFAAGWTASAVGDAVFFPHEQYMEGSFVGDLSGIALGIMVPGWKTKTLLVTGAHMLGKWIDHYRQPKV